MKTVQMTLDEKLLKEVDEVVKKKHTNRSAYTRDALLKAIKEEKIKELEEKHIKGYSNKNNVQKELTVMDDEQIWDDFNDTW